ncbi:hypothetical protein ACFLYU_03250 [Candidatus Dependentiae bacterium]
MKIKKRIATNIFASILGLGLSTITPCAHAKINFKKFIKAGGYTTLGIGATSIGIVTAMICYLAGGISIFSKTTKKEQLANTALMSAGPVFTAFYTAYRMFKNAFKALKSRPDKPKTPKKLCKKLKHKPKFALNTQKRKNLKKPNNIKKENL